MSQASRFPFFRRFWKPAVLTGASGAAIAVWFEEILVFAGEFLALIFLPIMAGVIFLLDHFIFKSRMPKREDLINTNLRGEKK